MILCCLQIVLIVESLSMLFLELLIFSLNQLELVNFGFKTAFYLIKFTLKLLQFLQVYVSLLTYYSVFFLKLFILLLLCNRLPLPLVFKLCVVFLYDFKLFLQLRFFFPFHLAFFSLIFWLSSDVFLQLLLPLMQFFSHFADLPLQTIKKDIFLLEQGEHGSFVVRGCICLLSSLFSF